MKQFIKSLLRFTLILFFVFLSVAILNYFMVTAEKYNVANGKNILILGDSNSQCAINDSIFKSSINVSTSAESYLYSYLKLKKILSANSHIDTVFLSFSPHNIFDNGWLFENKNMFYYFCRYFPLMKWSDVAILLRGNPKGFFCSILAIPRQFCINIYKKMKHKSIFSTYGGFQKIERNILAEVQKKLENDEPLPFFRIPDKISISKTEVFYLNNILALCEMKGIKLYLVNLPKRKELLSYPKYGVNEYYSYYDSFLKHIELLDFSEIKLSDDCYNDFVHLNRKGSTSFSIILEEEGMSGIRSRYTRK